MIEKYEYEEEEKYLFPFEVMGGAEYYWKKSHAYAYAMTVIVQMNLICENLETETPGV